MRSLRIILFVAFALLFVVSTNRCVIAAAFPGEVKECCPDDQSSGKSGSDRPCNGKDCESCATLESGATLAALAPLAVTAPVWTEDRLLAELTRRLADVAVDEVDLFTSDPAAIPPPPWCDVMVMALPVRGPSLVA